MVRTAVCILHIASSTRHDQTDILYNNNNDKHKSKYKYAHIEEHYHKQKTICVDIHGMENICVA
jgi:hypothetical protein